MPPFSVNLSRRRLVWLIIAAVAGAVGALSFAPLRWWWFAPLSLTVLFYAVAQSRSARVAAGVAFIFGGVFFAISLRWIFGALNGYIGLPLPAAAAIFTLLCAALALYPAVAAYIAWRIGGLGGFGRQTMEMRTLFAFAACWALAEWLRGILFTGFPWLAIGYSQTEPSPLSGWLPLLGIDGVNLAVALLAVFFILLMRRNMRTAAVMGIICIIGGGLLLAKVSWTTGKGHISVSLLQGNVPQSLKWQAGAVEKAMRDYLSMAKQASGKLIILPETALPIRWSDIPADYLQSLQEAAGDGAILAGLFMEDNGLHNAAAVLDKNGIGADYRKRHLTPYGEYLPFADILSPLLLAADIPYFSLSAGKKSAALPLLSTFAGISICYEDAFGDEWRSQLPAAQFLVNMTNDGWFDGSVMLAQHLQISQVRAAEFGRWLARATNTGLTAIINHKGEIVDFLPPQTQGILAGDIDLRIGATPLVRWGIWPSLLLSALLLLAVWAVGWRRSLRQ